MSEAPDKNAFSDFAIIESQQLQNLIDALTSIGYRVMAPTVRDGAIVYGDTDRVASLPIGWTDKQDGGSYRLTKRGDNAFFGYAVGPHSWKRFLHPPQTRLWKACREGAGFEIITGLRDPARFAFLGVRSCELHAISIQDRVFLDNQYVDPVYASARERVFIVAINCTSPGGTCFCASMGTGPRVAEGFDLALTEILDERSHYFLVQTGSIAGGEILAQVPHKQATAEQVHEAETRMSNVAGHMGREMDTSEIKEMLYRNYDNPRWDQVARRCLTCANCTMVCPTCFCTTIEDTTDLTGQNAERWRRWDSCFTMDFSYIHGGSVRASAMSRYRQWMTHKLATWFDQFGTSGCVGCGRCITWCPVGIDITEEARAIRESERGAKEESHGDA